MRGQSTRLPVWHGTRPETADLLMAALHHCTCVVDDNSVRVVTCPPHAMVFNDQRAINGLLFARRMSKRLLAEEFASGNSTPASA